MKSPFISFNFIIGICLEVGSIVFFLLVSRRLYYGGGAPVLHIVCVIIYSLGGYYIYKSGIPYFAKLIFVYWWVAWIIIWVSIWTITYWIESAKTKDETYLIPYGYHGKIDVYYNQPDGDPTAFEGDRLVFSMREDSTIRTQYKRNRNNNYPNDTHPLVYYIDTNNKRTLIKQMGDSTIQADEVFADTGGYEYDAEKPDILKTCILIFTQKEWDAHHNR
jgi:hypothetical protein